MDQVRFDQLTRGISGSRSRRHGLRGLLAVVVAGLADRLAGERAATAKPRRRRGPAAQGPCGNGSAKANRCRRHRQCCTGYCHRKTQRCRCRKRGQPCTADRNCCRGRGQQLTCQDGRCQPPASCGSQGTSCTGDGECCVPLLCEESSQTCQPGCGDGGPCRVFVTSSGHPGNLGGLAGADAICQSFAAGADLPGAYRAWLSDATGSPATRFTRSPRPYVLVDAAATMIATSWADLTDGQLLAPINVDETGASLDPSFVWTNTQADGTATSGTEHCGNWTVPLALEVGRVGLTFVTDSQWTAADFSPCDLPRHLYCFQQR